MSYIRGGRKFWTSSQNQALSTSEKSIETNVYSVMDYLRSSKDIIHNNVKNVLGEDNWNELAECDIVPIENLISKPKKTIVKTGVLGGVGLAAYHMLVAHSQNILT